MRPLHQILPSQLPLDLLATSQGALRHQLERTKKPNLEVYVNDYQSKCQTKAGAPQTKHGHGRLRPAATREAVHLSAWQLAKLPKSGITKDAGELASHGSPAGSLANPLLGTGAAAGCGEVARQRALRLQLFHEPGGLGDPAKNAAAMWAHLAEKAKPSHKLVWGENEAQTCVFDRGQASGAITAEPIALLARAPDGLDLASRPSMARARL